MRKKNLEMILQGVKGYSNPKARLEQYLTSASIAADILFRAYSLGDIEDKIIGDLGCGTGMFSIGAEILGARKIYAVDIDKEAIEDMIENIKRFKCENIEIFCKDVRDMEISVDTVLQNPPFGSQNRHADLPFLIKSTEIGNVVYTIHNAVTLNFIRVKIKTLGWKITHEFHYNFEIPRLFDFHTHEKIFREVILLRIVKQ